MRDRLADAVAGRTRHERVLLALLFHERMTPLEVASTLGLSVPSVLRHARRLLEELRQGTVAGSLQEARIAQDGMR